MVKFDKGTKESIQFISSLLILLLGVILVFVSLFIDPVGIIHPSVITVFGMFLSFVGAIWNIDLKYEYKSRELERDIDRHFRREGHYEDNDEVETL